MEAGGATGGQTGAERDELNNSVSYPPRKTSNTNNVLRAWRRLRLRSTRKRLRDAIPARIIASALESYLEPHFACRYLPAPHPIPLPDGARAIGSLLRAVKPLMLEAFGVLYLAPTGSGRPKAG